MNSTDVTAPQPPDRSPDQVLHDLRQPVPDAPASGAIGALLTAAVTFGLAPALLWPIGWAAFVAGERRQYEALAQWLRRNIRHPNLAAVHARASAVRPVRLLLALPIVCAALWALLVILLTTGGARPMFELLIDSTYHYSRAAYWPRLAADWEAGLPPAAVVFTSWVGLLSVGFACQWLQVQVHAWRVRRFLDEFNQIVVDEALSPVFLQPVGVGLRPLWVAGAVLLILNSALWGVPMAMAGAVQRTYTRTAGPAMRGALAARMRDLMLLYRGPAAAAWMQQQAAPPPDASAQRMRCETPGCRMTLPPGARFCPRCGARAVAALDRVA